VRMGLHPSLAFACAIDFLFRIRPQTLEPYTAELATLSDPDTLKIGIQIRVGDKVFTTGEDSSTVEVYRAFFDCAAQIEASRRRSADQKVVYYLISDSTRLRRLAAEAFGAKLLTSVDGVVKHTRKKRSADPAEVLKAFRAAVAEMWLFSLCDYHTTTLRSGFGRTGAFMSGRYHHYFPIDMDHPAQAVNRSCGSLDYLPTHDWNM